MNDSESHRERRWTWVEVAAWFDTEGTFTPVRKVQAVVAQKERKVLDSLGNFLSSQKIHSNVYWYPRKRGHVLIVSGAINVIRVVNRILRLLRVESKKKAAAETLRMAELVRRTRGKPRRIRFPS